MDKRIEKTRKAIYRAFIEELREKPIEKITVENLLERSGVSRSTFYSHFKTKNEVMDSVADDIFDHVFSASLHGEKTHDFSKSNVFDYDHMLTHAFYHFRDEKELIGAILSSSGSDAFFRVLRSKISPIGQKCLQTGLIPAKKIPAELQVEQISNSFVSLLAYWFNNGVKESPETVTAYFFELNR